MQRKLKEIVLASQLSSQEVAELLAPFGFTDPIRADARLQAIAGEPRSRRLLAEILQPLLNAISRSPDPDQALLYFERFAEASLNKLTLLGYLKEVPHAVPLLAQAFGASPFISQILHRNPYHLYWIAEPRVLENSPSKGELNRELLRIFRSVRSHADRLDLLRAFKRKELLRIGVRDLLRETTVAETVRDLTTLAEAVVRATLDLSRKELRRNLGERSRSSTKGFVILALGKLGGGELNFSSDIDLIYLYRNGGKDEFYRRLAQEVTTALSRVTGEGSLFRVDLRLRPEGATGNIADSLSRYTRYYRSRGKNWERLALLKAWPIAGDLALGSRFLKEIRPFVHPRRPDPALFKEVAEIKEEIERKIGPRSGRERNVKLGRGGIREIEFLVQAIQVSLGGRFPAIRERNTVRAIAKLRRSGFLSLEDARRLSEAYLFLRDVEHKLQMVYETQTHSLPESPAAFRCCALRLGYRDNQEEKAEGRFRADLDRHRTEVRRLFEGLFYAKDSEILGRVRTRMG
jgi:glutamate-ammonia-ligase adenylyltransferase